jgi:hypothetical protein
MAVGGVLCEPFSVKFPANGEKYREIHEFEPGIWRAALRILLNPLEFHLQSITLRAAKNRELSPAYQGISIP